MLIAALLCGLVTAYYFGIKAGTYAAAIAAGLFFAAQVIPGWSSWAYALIAGGLIGVCFVGPRFGKPLGKHKAFLALRSVVGRFYKPFKK